MGFPPIDTTEDISKLHSESQQLRNQQFILATLGLTAVGLSAWFIPKLPANTQDDCSLGLVSLFLTVLLAVLFGWSITLRRLIGTISHYIELRAASEWEPLFRKFSTRRGSRYWSQTVSIAVLYFVLGGIVVANFFLVRASEEIAPMPIFEYLVPGAGVLLAIFIVCLTASRYVFDRKVREKWGDLLNDEFLSTVPALLVTKAASKRDSALAAGARGARKLVVTELYAQKEREATSVEWTPPSLDDKCAVQVMSNAEVAVFNQHASQDSHFHKRGTELYMVIKGEMVIDVDAIEYTLSSGDMIVVNPNAIHQVKPDGAEFLCRVVTLNCGGAEDKHFPETTT